MRISTTLVIALTGLGGVAAAQPNPTGEPGTGTTDVTPQPPPEPPQPPHPPPQPIEHTMPMTSTSPSAVRPTELAFAIGLGYFRAPGGSLDLQTPNIASVRLRLLSGLEFEPTISIANSSANMDNGTTTMTDTITDFAVGTLARLPVITHGHVDFQVLGSLGFGVSKDNPDGDFNTKTTTTLSLGWGIGIGYWFSPHWQLSASATNPLVGYQSVKQDTSSTTSTKTTTTSFGVTFSPGIFAMLHLYN